jgi:hypothetical protein
MLSWNGSPKSSILLGYLTKSTYKPFSCDSASLSWTPPDYSSATNLMAASREWWTLHPWWWNHILFTLSKFKRVISSIIFTLFHGESLYEMFFLSYFCSQEIMLFHVWWWVTTNGTPTIGPLDHSDSFHSHWPSPGFLSDLVRRFEVRSMPFELWTLPGPPQW